MQETGPRHETTTIRWEQDDTGVVTLVLDDPDQSANTMTEAFRASLSAVADRPRPSAEADRRGHPHLRQEDLLRRRRPQGPARAGPSTPRQVFDAGQAIRRSLRRLETLGVPVVAALNGAPSAAATRSPSRATTASPSTRRAPGSACPRSPSVCCPAAVASSAPCGCSGCGRAAQGPAPGHPPTPGRALENGLVHEVAALPSDCWRNARVHRANPAVPQPWDTRGYRIPGGTPVHPRFAADLPALPAELRKQTGGAPIPGAAQHPGRGRRGHPGRLRDRRGVEARYFTELVTGPDRQEHDPGLLLRPADRQLRRRAARRASRPRPVRGVAVLGAGMMGAGIAHSCACAGNRGRALKDVSAEAAATWQGVFREAAGKALAGAARPRRGGDALLARITPTADPADLAGCDVVIEAVFEDPALKQKVFEEIEDIVAPDALPCSNTSTLPITELAEGVARPVRLHRTALLLAGRPDAPGRDHRGRSDRRRGARPRLRPGAADPQDPDRRRRRRGFFTSRVIGRFLVEAVAMVGEGVDPASVEQAAAQAGYPA